LAAWLERRLQHSEQACLVGDVQKHIAAVDRIVAVDAFQFQAIAPLQVYPIAQTVGGEFAFGQREHVA
jgi:hypothetical protein